MQSKRVEHAEVAVDVPIRDERASEMLEQGMNISENFKGSLVVLQEEWLRDTAACVDPFRAVASLYINQKVITYHHRCGSLSLSLCLCSLLPLTSTIRTSWDVHNTAVCMSMLFADANLGYQFLGYQFRISPLEQDAPAKLPGRMPSGWPNGSGDPMGSCATSVLSGKGYSVRAVVFVFVSTPHSLCA
jgi:hypothetical protein